MRAVLRPLLIAGGLVVAAISNAPVAVSAVPAGAASAPPCFGLAPTVVAEPGTTEVVGTEGDDVVVVSDVSRVITLGGDDTVCATGARWIDAGDGDDRVRHRSTAGSWVVLGSGSDLFEGSDARDRVYAERFDGEDPYPGEGPDNTDVVRTYGGRDSVTTMAGPQGPDRDRVSLGDGDDTVTAYGLAPGDDRRLRGGAGRDTVVLTAAGAAGSELVVDLEDGRARLDGETVAVADAFEDVVGRAGSADLTVLGTDGPNAISVVGSAAVDARGGRDRITLHGDPRSVRGGPGIDHVEVQGYADLEDLPVRYDLHRRTFTRNGATVPFAVEKLLVRSTGALREDVVVLGTPGRDVVVMRACGGVVRGAGGDDVLRSRAEQCEDTRTVLRGGPGDDRLSGDVDGEVLIGGAGRDRAVGGAGTDRCRAEIERECELE
ncbi:hypothetical protein [Nocardioides abyssi]|uniref:Calcium-binding protein n=1 Tax=Nocardioides abyssi TaxID=3058370 RepID=A0ABT8EXX9_9ACTN|nr:hypothetical protein [Nocardioides abyssi]MDN4162992.1 hypothetical protein [Nocardioides abyssi]